MRLPRTSSLRGRIDRTLVGVGIPFFVVAAVFTYYGQLNRDQTGDVYGVIYTSVAIVQKHTIWLDEYKPYIQQHAGENPYMLASGPGGHVVNATPSASSILALPVVAAFTAAGARASDWHAWMNASMLTAALASAACVAAMFVLLGRLTTRRRATVLTAVFAWGTLEWSINGQSLWQHTGSCLALTLALLAFVDRRLVFAGVAVSAMVAFRSSTPIIVLFLLPLIGRRVSDWLRFAAGILPFLLPLLAYNWVAFGSPLHQGYGMAKVTSYLDLRSLRFLHGAPALLVSPGRGVLFYCPVLLFGIIGFVRGRRTPLYRWCGVAALAYAVVAANDIEWWGGESFGPRKWTEIVPLLTVLLVPALDTLSSKRARRFFAATAVYSVFVELLAAAAWPPSSWFDKNPDLTRYSLWWSFTNNELVSKLETSGLALRLTEMTLLLVGSLVLGLIATQAMSDLRRGEREPAIRPG